MLINFFHTTLRDFKVDLVIVWNPLSKCILVSLIHGELLYTGTHTSSYYNYYLQVIVLLEELHESGLIPQHHGGMEFRMVVTHGISIVGFHVWPVNVFSDGPCSPTNAKTDHLGLLSNSIKVPTLTSPQTKLGSALEVYPQSTAVIYSITLGTRVHLGFSPMRGERKR